VTNIILEPISYYNVYLIEFEYGMNVLSNLVLLKGEGVFIFGLLLLFIFCFYKKGLGVYHFFFLGLVHFLTGFFIIF
jgi:hypothetical protein